MLDYAQIVRYIMSEVYAQNEHEQIVIKGGVNMLAQEFRNLERANAALRNALLDLEEKIDRSENKPMKCDICKHFVPHYIKSDYSFTEIDWGHCTRGSGGTKKSYKRSSETCKSFELGTYGIKYVE